MAGKFPSHLIDAEKLKQDMEYNPLDLDTAMTQQASLATYYGVQASAAARIAGLAKIRLQTTEAKVYKKLRTAAADEGRKMTEAQLNNEVALDPRVIGAKKEFYDATYYADLGRQATEAFRQRRDMLVQLNKEALEERRGELRGYGGDMDAAKERALQTVNGNA